MTIEVHKIQRLRFIEEAAGSFAIDQTASLGSFLDMPAIEGSMSLTLEQQTLPQSYLQQHKDEVVRDVLGRKAVRFSFQTLLASTGTAAGSTIAAISSALSGILKAVMGAETKSTGTAIASGPAVTGYVVTAATGMGPGQALGTTISGAIEWRITKSVSGTTIVHKLNTSAAPSGGAVIYGANTLSLIQDPQTSLQFAVEGFEQDDRWLLQGCQLESMAIEITPGQLPTITFGFVGATWTHGASTTVALTGSALGAATYSTILPAAAVDGAYYQQTVGTVTYNGTTSRLPVASEIWTPSIGYIPQTSPTGVQTVLRYVRNRTAPVMSGSFNIPYEDPTWHTARNDRAIKALVRQIGSAAGSTVLIEVPTVQITDVQRVDEGGLAYQQVSWKARNDAETSGSTDIQESAFRIHLG